MAIKVEAGVTKRMTLNSQRIKQIRISGNRRYALHDHDTKFCSVFRATLATGGIKPIQLPARSPNLNAYAERWVRSAKQECLSKLILFGEASLRRALTAFIDHHHQERNHQGKDNLLLSPIPVLEAGSRGAICCHEGSVASQVLQVRRMNYLTKRPPSGPNSSHPSHACGEAASETVGNSAFTFGRERHEP
jgi:hypothetical protein